MEATVVVHIPDGNETLISDIERMLEARLENHTSDKRPRMRVKRDNTYEITVKASVQE